MPRPLRAQMIAVAVVICALSASLVRAEWVRVVRVIDGDTFVTADGTKVRVQGIDTPETNHPKKPKEPGGEAATVLAQSYLEGRWVWLEGQAEDPYGRRVAKVRLPDGRWYDEIVRSRGYDKSATPVISPVGSWKGAGANSFSRPQYPGRGPSRELASERSWVEGYYRKDGTWVSGYWRAKPSRSLSSPTPASRSPTWKSPASSSGASAAGMVPVRGYFRKDGTYVRPHVRSKSRP